MKLQDLLAESWIPAPISAGIKNAVEANDVQSLLTHLLVLIHHVAPNHLKSDKDLVGTLAKDQAEAAKSKE